MEVILSHLLTNNKNNITVPMVFYIVIYYNTYYLKQQYYSVWDEVYYQIYNCHIRDKSQLRLKKFNMIRTCKTLVIMIVIKSDNVLPDMVTKQ